MNAASAHALPAPLAVVGLAAVGASGLDACALAAAVWSSLARFELADDAALGLSLGPDAALRISPCPLFDAATPPCERLAEMLQRCCGKLATAFDRMVQPGLYLVAPCPTQRPGLQADWAARTTPSPQRIWSGGAGRWAAALAEVGSALHGAPGQTLGVLAGADTLLGTQTLRRLHQAGRLSTESAAAGLIPGEAAAALALCTPQTATALGLPVRATLLGASSLPYSDGGAALALVAAVRAALGASPAGPALVHTVLWDIDAPDTHLIPMADAFATLCAELNQATLSRPFMQLGDLGAALGPVAAVLAIEGARAGVTQGGRSLIVTLGGNTATAVYLDAPWQPQIMLQDRAAP